MRGYLDCTRGQGKVGTARETERYLPTAFREDGTGSGIRSGSWPPILARTRSMRLQYRNAPQRVLGVHHSSLWWRNSRWDPSLSRRWRSSLPSSATGNG